MSVAIFDRIAARTGVSRRTVRRLLSGPLRDTRPSIVRRAAEVRALATQLGYRPNAAARAVATGRFRAATLLMSTAGGRSHSSLGLLRGVHDAIAGADMHLNVAWLPDEKLVSGDGLPKVFREWFCDGLLINYNSDIPPRLASLIESHRLPVVWINADRPDDCVRPDDVAAGRLATRHLVGRGCRQIAYLQAGSGPHYSEAARQRGYRAALRGARLAPRVDVLPLPSGALPGSGDPRERRALLAAWLARPGRPEAVVTYSSWTAEPLLVAALEAGLRVPRDLAIVTIEDEPATHTGFALTTVVLGMQELGQAAVRLLLRKIDSPETPLPAVRVAPRLVAGETA